MPHPNHTGKASAPEVRLRPISSRGILEESPGLTVLASRILEVVSTLSATIFKGRQAAAIENDHLRVTVLREGGHIAEIFDKVAGVSPLWVPPWPSIEPSTYQLSKHPEYGSDSEAKLLAGIMGHNLCLDFFGGPSRKNPHRVDRAWRRFRSSVRDH